MKILTLTALIFLCFSINTYATEFKFVAGNNESITKICLAAVTDNTKVMVDNLRMLSRRGSALSFRTFVNSIQCNNQYIGNFAKTYDAQNTFAYLEQYTNKKNKKRQPNITIKEVAKGHELNKDKTIVVVVGSN